LDYSTEKGTTIVKQSLTSGSDAEGHICLSLSVTMYSISSRVGKLEDRVRRLGNSKVERNLREEEEDQM
jgi:hypothetical protein